jgi:hypothetical protein
MFRIVNIRIFNNTISWVGNPYANGTKAIPKELLPIYDRPVITSSKINKIGKMYRLPFKSLSELYC